MTTPTRKRYIVEVEIDEDLVADSPYWPLAASGRPHDAAVAQLVAAEIQAGLEHLGYVSRAKVTESYD